ncbi:hypothetical protein A0X14_06840 [Campylobacter coli]|nr:hypothetical protein [Campylobacter coli]EAJ6872166.1 hypothetical protein [Campylobacter coli]HEB9315242.1 hypothetical protein [Campylobacter coli]HEH4645548.1 hypothetical protein [Campylobacter coli]
MEKEIIDIIKSLISGNLTFIGLIFTSLGIIFSFKDNWKTKSLKKSNEFSQFINSHIISIIVVIALFLISFVIILFDNNKVLFYLLLLIYGILILCLCYLIVKIAFRYKSLIELLKDDSKPILSIEAHDNEEEE